MRNLLIASLIFVALPAYGELNESALGNSGELYTVHTDTYGELFPEGDAAAARHEVLALDVTAINGDSNRLLVPGTGDARTESEARVLYSSKGGAAVVLWHSIDEDGLRLDFVSRAGGEWTEVHSLTDRDGEALLMDRAPLIAVTHDKVDLTIGDTSLNAERSVVHVLSQTAGAITYAPILFVEGTYAGHETVDLGASFLLGEEPGATPSSGLRQALSLQVADAKRSVRVAFTNPDSSRLGVLEIGLLPLEVELLGDHVRDQIFARADLYDPDDISNFAGEIRAELIGVGYNLEMHPGIVDFASEQLGDWIEASAADYGLEGFQALGQDARDVTMYLAGSVTSSLVSDPATGDEILEIQLGDFLAALNAESTDPQYVDVQVLADLPVPAIGQGATALFTSQDGGDVLIGWKPDSKDRVFYVESRPDGESWTGRKSLQLSSSLSLDQAIQLLAQKIR